MTSIDENNVKSVSEFTVYASYFESVNITDS